MDQDAVVAAELIEELGRVEARMREAMVDALLHGTGFMKDGQHVPISEVYEWPLGERDGKRAECVHDFTISAPKFCLKCGWREEQE
jgi:hypothetical protein